MRMFWTSVIIITTVLFFLSLPVYSENEKKDECTYLINPDEVTTVQGVVEENPDPIKHRRKSLSSRGLNIVQTASRYLGTPYLWAGITPAGFDCSGFVMRVFSLNGVNIRRMADEQYYSGVKVKKEDLMPGDLVFFTTYGPGVTHVGIFIGEDKFIHSSLKRGVTISSLNEPYYKARFLGGCRY